MIEAIVKLIAALIPFIFGRKENESQSEKRIAEFDKALVDRDAGTISGLFDRMRVPGSEDGSDPVGQDDNKTEKR